MTVELLNIDCMEYMATLPDKAFDLAIVDPPYGINHSTNAGKAGGTKYGTAKAAKRKYKEKDWDKNPPSSEYFDELRRVSANQIIWGANYMVGDIMPSMGWVVWDKDNGETNFSDCELAYTSFNVRLRKFKYTWNGMVQENMKNKEDRIHPTQKPKGLYRWIMKTYAKPDQRILDTHLGSGSSAIAAHYFGCDFVGCELDEDYYNAAVERFNLETAQKALF
jgi:site-specific DNA-methyltransferase (adenine-specific)